MNNKKLTINFLRSTDIKILINIVILKDKHLIFILNKKRINIIVIEINFY